METGLVVHAPVPYAFDALDPPPWNGCSAKFTAALLYVELGNQVPFPLDQRLVAVMAVGVASLMARHIT